MGKIFEITKKVMGTMFTIHNTYFPPHPAHAGKTERPTRISASNGSVYLISHGHGSYLIICIVILHNTFNSNYLNKSVVV